MSWKGTKENISNLPQSGNQTGDLWHVNEDGNEYAWDGSKWEALGGIHSGGSVPFEIPITVSGSTYTTTVSAADILANKDNCAIVINNDMWIPLDYYSVSNDTTYLFFDTTSVADNPPQIVNVLVQVSNNTVLVSQGDYAIRSVPPVFSTDNGKILGVVNGAWTTIPPANALVIDWNNKYANAYNDAKAAMQDGREVYLKIPNAENNPTQCTYLQATSWDQTYIVFGGFTGAYLPGEMFIFTYAHITDGLSNWFKWSTNFTFNPVLFRNLAPAYSSSSTYDLGDYVNHGSNVYKCTTTISTPEEWNSAHWTAVTVMDEVVTSGGGSGLPDTTSASAGDFLRLDAQKNPVWEAIPSAESNSFGGGS